MSSVAVTYTFANATTADATQVNQNFSDLVTFINNSVVHTHDIARVGCRIRRAANQSINDSTGTQISFDTEDQDTDGFFAPTSTTVTIPAGKSGIYVIRFNIIPGTTINNRLLGDIKYANGTGTLPTGQTTQVRNEGNTPSTRASVTDVAALVAGNQVTFEVFHTHGTAQNFTADVNLMRVAI